MTDTVLKFIGERIRKARERLGMTQEELAARIDKNQNAISGYESGSRAIRITEIPQLAQALNVSIAYFFGDIDPDEEIVALLAEFPPEHRKTVLARLRFELDLLRQSKKEDN